MHFAWGRSPRVIQLARFGLYEPTGVVVAEVKVHCRERDEQRTYDIPEIRRDKRPKRKSRQPDQETNPLSRDGLSNVLRGGQLDDV